MDHHYTLGLDLGTNSIGWALLDKNGDEYALEKIGVRIFSQVTEPKSGKIKNADRRVSRGMRRNIARRVRRQSHLLHLLIENGLLPSVDFTKDGDSFQENYWNHPDLQELVQKNPLFLRSAGLKEKLEIYEFGRALYHLGQKRGFKSTAKREKKEDTDKKKISEFKKKISELKQKLDGRTLGQYFSDESEKGNSTRNQGTSRDLYEDEFARLWHFQQKFYPEILSDELRSLVYEAIFFQRPLKSQDDLIGECKYYPNEKKLPKSHPLAQEFIILGQLGNLTIVNDSYRKVDIEEHFGDRLEVKLQEGLDLFRSEKEISLTDITKWLEIADSRMINTTKKSWKGDKLYKKLTMILGDEYRDFSPEKQNGIIEALKQEDKEMSHRGGKYKTKKGKEVIVLGYEYWNIDEKFWDVLDAIDPEIIPSKYIELGETAVLKFLPEMRKGKSFKTIEKELREKGELPKEYHNKYQNCMNLKRLKKSTAKSRWELHSNHLPDIRNPRVTKVLVELRKLLRAITNEYGSLAKIRIEMSRDLKNSEKIRSDITKKQRENEERNKKYQEEMEKDFPGANTDIHSDDFLRYKLWKELRIDKISPYHRKGNPDRDIHIASHDLYSPEFEIEHILPLSRSLDDSFLNKTLCPRDINLDKGERTPFEYYGGPSSPDWKAFEKRVWNIFGYVRKGEKEPRLSAKGRRLLMTPEEVKEKFEKFTTQDLNDTSYMAREAVEFCQALQGEARGKQQMVQTSKGQLTSVLRYHWRWNELLNPDISDPDAKNKKNRHDHRHHAIDAVIIALSDGGMIQEASRLAQEAEEAHKKLDHLRTIWTRTIPNIEWLTGELSRQIDTLHISHAQNHKVRGALHKETNYGLRDYDGEKKVTTRKKMGDFVDELIKVKGKEEEIQKKCVGIIDPIIRDDLVAKALSGELQTPYFHPANGVEIKGIRIHDASLTPDGLLPFGKGLYKNDDNHHIEILECTSGKKKGTKVGIVVQLSEAYERKKLGPDHIYNRVGPWIDLKDKKTYSPDEYGYLFSLTKGDLVEREDGEIYQFTACNNQKTLFFYPERVSEKTKEVLWQPKPGTLKARKVQVDLLGNISLAND